MAFREASLETSAPPAKVWRVWSDINHWPEWNPEAYESRFDGALKLGAAGVIHTKSRGRHDVVVTRYEEGLSFDLESTALPGTRLTIRATVTPKGGGSRITQGFEPRGLLAPMVDRMMSGRILKTFDSTLSGLKHKAEAELRPPR